MSEEEKERRKKDIIDMLNKTMSHLRSAKHLLEELFGEREMHRYNIIFLAEDIDYIIDELGDIIEDYVTSY